MLAAPAAGPKESTLGADRGEETVSDRYRGWVRGQFICHGILGNAGVVRTYDDGQMHRCAVVPPRYEWPLVDRLCCRTEFSCALFVPRTHVGVVAPGFAGNVMDAGAGGSR